MTETPQTFNRAERVFGTQIERAEKGSAMSMIRAEVDARNAKSERLRSLRMAQVAIAAAVPVVKATKTARRKAAVAEPAK